MTALRTIAASLAWFGSATALSGCGGASARVPFRPTAPPTAFEIDSALLRLAATPLWPHFDPRSAPIAYYDGERTLLFRHPHPPAAFVADAVRADVAVRRGRDAKLTANSSVAIDGVSTATVILAPERRASAEESASLGIHELFHVFERARHPSWIANEADLFTYPFDDVEALTLRREETAALRAAAMATDDDGARCWAGAFLDARRARFRIIGGEAAAYERGTELNEGLAQYVERHSIGKPPSLSPQDYPADQVRQRAYATGESIARLLDRLRPDWRDSLDAMPAASLVPIDSALSLTLTPGFGAVATPRLCRISTSDHAAFESAAAADVDALRSLRQKRRAEFIGRTGARVEVVAGAAPLFPQGFDPLNVQRLTDAEILHSRFLQLGGAEGSIEVLGHSALTTGKPGGHPLFSGVQRLVITGLATLPMVRDSSGTLIIRGDGVSGHFRGARVDSSGTRLTIKLP